MKCSPRVKTDGELERLLKSGLWIRL